MGQGSVAARDVTTLLTRQLTRCGYQGRAWPISDMVWHGSYGAPAAVDTWQGPAAYGAPALEKACSKAIDEAFDEVRSKAKAKPKTKAKTKAKPKPVSKAKAKPKTKTNAKAKPKPVSKAMQKVWKHCQ